MATPKGTHREDREVTLPTQPTTGCLAQEAHSMLVCPPTLGYHSPASPMGLLSLSKIECLVQDLPPVRILVTHTSKADRVCLI